MPRPASDQQHDHDHHDPHIKGRWLSDLVLGAQDGIVNTLGVILGVASATADMRVILATGMATAAAESISMAAVAYTSSVARGDLYRAELAREYRHVEEAPDIERDEIRTIFRVRGFSGEMLERAVDTVCSNREVWVAMMMAEEHQLTPVDRATSLRSAAVAGGASLVASTIPVLPFALPYGRIVVVASLAVGVIQLFALGAFKAKITTGSPTRSALTLAAIGLASALAGFAVGAIFAPS
jgi:VIT1/CCC1 family predicted Fe2+/Mn2+ transporter